MGKIFRTGALLTAVVVLTAPIIACQGGGMGAANAGPRQETLALPLPEGTQIIAPGPDVSKDFAAFGGVWSGTWNGVMPSLLIVERVSPSGDAQGVYVWGAVPHWRVTAGSSKFRAKIENGTLSWGGTRKFEFTINQDGK